MSVKRIHLLLLGIVAGLAATAVAGQESKPAPDFKEVYDLVLEHLADATPAELNRAAVEGFVAKLAPRVSLVTSNELSKPSEGPLVSRNIVLDGSIGFIRIARVDDGLAEAFKAAHGQLTATNKLKGLVLDLRYASGSSYASVPGLVNLFSKKKQPVLNWGEGMKETDQNPDAITLPAAILVNTETAGAAEALGAVFRELGAALIFGNRTAGQAMITKDYPLQDGGLLRVGVSPIELAGGTTLGDDGVAPDITVRVNPQDEKAYFADPYAQPNRSTNSAVGTGIVDNATNRTVRRPRLNEAELVRERREGGRPDSEAGSEAEPLRPSVQDPVLARALDVLKGLAVIRRIGS